MKKKAKKRGKFFRRFVASITRPEMLVLPGQIAFFLFLSIVPTITLISYVSMYLNISNALINKVIGSAIGDNYASMLVPIINSTKITPSFFISLGVGTLFEFRCRDDGISCRNFKILKRTFFMVGNIYLC